MYALRVFGVFLSAIIFSAASFAQTDWDPETEIPEITFVGEYSEAEAELGAQMRRGLVDYVTYWKKLGLSNPVDLDGVFVMAFTDNKKVSEIVNELNPSIPNASEHVIQQWEALDGSELAFFLRKFQGQLQTKGRVRANLLFSQFLLRFRAEPLREILYDFKKIVFADEGGHNHMVEGADQDEPSYLQRLEEGELDLIDLFFDYYTYLRYGWSVNDLHKAIQQGLTHGQAKELGGGLSMIPDTDNAFVGQFPKLDLSVLLLPAVDQNPERNVQWNRLINVEALNEIGKDGQIPVTSRMVFLPRTTQGYDDTEVSILHDKPVGYHEFGHQIQASIQQVNRLVNEALADLLAVGFTNDPKVGVFFAEASGVIADRLEERGDLSDEEKRIVAAFRRLAAKGYIRDMSEDYPLNKLPRYGYFPDDYTAGHPLRNFLWRAREQSGLEKNDFDMKLLESLVEFAELPMNINSKAQGRIAMRQAILNILGGPGSRLGDGVETAGRTLHSILAMMRIRFIPRASHDYVTIEFIRTFFRNLVTSFPQAQEAVKKLAEEIVGRKAMVIETAGNMKEILFAHGPRAALSRGLWARRFARLETLRRELGQSDVSPERLAKIQREYDIILRSIQEFERTLHVGAIVSPVMTGVFGVAKQAVGRAAAIPKVLTKNRQTTAGSAVRTCESLF